MEGARRAMADSVLGRRLRHGNDRHDNDNDHDHDNPNQFEPAAPAAACRWPYVIHVEHLYIRHDKSLYIRRHDKSLYVRRHDKSLYVRRNVESLYIRYVESLLRRHKHGHHVSLPDHGIGRTRL